MELSTTAKLLREIDGFGRGAQFVANIVQTRMTKPTTRLRGLLALLKAGHEVSTPNTDVLWVNGRAAEWSILLATSTLRKRYAGGVR